MSKQIAFFDFDGTITTKDTMKAFFIFLNGKAHWYKGLVLNVFPLAKYSLRLISADAAKEKIFIHHLKNKSVDEVNNKCAIFCEEVLPGLLRPKALKEIKRLKNFGVDVVIVSASAENWIKPWADQQNIAVVATQLEQQGDSFTGKYLGKNCNRKEKVNRIRKNYDLKQYDQIIAYGDSSGDKEMFALAHETFFKPFV